MAGSIVSKNNAARNPPSAPDRCILMYTEFMTFTGKVCEAVRSLTAFMRHGGRQSISLFCLLLLFFHSQLSSQQPDEVRFGVKSGVVLLDVVVTGSKGEMLKNLRREEIQVLERGNSREIVFFD